MRKRTLFGIIITFLVIAIAYFNNSSSISAGEVKSNMGVGGDAIGFLFVGPRDDYGYNQAAYNGSEAVKEAFPFMKLLRVENVPETAEAERVMEEMIRSGAKVIFPTSYGHLDPALEVAKRHRDVVFLHQGGLKTAENLGTYFSNIFEVIYLSGVAAGKMTKTNKLGFIASFPIPQVLLNINAYTLGVRSVNPDANVIAVFNGSWCDPGKQASAANTLIDQGCDVLTQHQDCTKTIIETAERRGVMSSGYHCDALEIAPEGWITGAYWNWDDLYVNMCDVILNGEFKGSPYDGRFRTGIHEGVAKLARFGKNVPDDVKKLVKEKQKEILDYKFYPFTGPVRDQSGTVRIEPGVVPTVAELETTDYLVEGSIGNIPK
jgi:basic membrane lipoprotein Med (substrate-binding protein (PBP1-ABC) superfamily)